MKRVLFLFVFLVVSTISYSQTRSGGYGSPQMYFKRYMHLIPGVNTFHLPTMPSIGGVLSDLAHPDKPEPRVKTIEEYHKEFLALPEDKQIEMKNILHPDWELDRFKNSQSAVYATFLEIEKNK